MLAVYSRILFVLNQVKRTHNDSMDMKEKRKEFSSKETKKEKGSAYKSMMRFSGGQKVILV